MMGRIYLSAILLAGFALSSAQTEYQSVIQKPLKKIATVNLGDAGPSSGVLQYLEMPKPGGERYDRFLQEQKKKVAEAFPEKETTVQPGTRSFVDPPEILGGFNGNSANGIPLDNHLALNRDGQLVSVVNVQMLVVNPQGFWLESYSLDDFWAELGESDRYFDPRVIYDPIADRFVLTMMQDYNCSGSNIVFGFSESSDPLGAWHLYQFEGCPKNDATFADFPMISLTDKEVFFTYNAVYQDSSWQTGFNETYIYQINKSDGYSGSDLRWRSWEGIKFNGSKLRYICPVKYADQDFKSESWFLSNRSFDVQNDTIFLLHIDGDMDKPGVALTVQAMISDPAYGVPPNAAQPKDFLQTNDARVLDAFVLNDQIQFVSNTVDPETGRSAIFHGVVSDIDTEPLLWSNILGSTDHLAYPGIVYAGVSPDERDAVIVAAHASPDRFPGYSALYFNNEYSEWATVKEGLRVIDMFKEGNPFGVDPTIERWGDYTGIQRDFTAPGEFWTASTYGKPGSVNDTWIGHLKKPEIPSGVQVPENSTRVVAYPNPANTTITFEIEAQSAGEKLVATMYDMNGVMVAEVFESTIAREVPFLFHYNVANMPSGTYAMVVAVDGRQVASRKVVVQ